MPTGLQRIPSAHQTSPSLRRTRFHLRELVSSRRAQSRSYQQPAGSISSSSHMKIDNPAQPPLAASVMVQSTEPEKICVLLARAKEASEIRQQKGVGWEREKARRGLRELEKAVRPYESLHSRDLEQVGINEFEYVLEELGIFLRPDV